LSDLRRRTPILVIRVNQIDLVGDAHPDTIATMKVAAVVPQIVFTVMWVVDATMVESYRDQELQVLAIATRNQWMEHMPRYAW